MTARHWTAIAIAAWALAAVVALTSCCPRVPAPVVAPPCALGPPPVRAHFLTARPDCPAPLVCYAPKDEAGLLGELQARRDYDARVAACLSPAAPLPPPRKPPPDERARVAPAP